MANTKAFLIVIFFAAILISSYEVSARELADPHSTRQTQSVEESKQSYTGGGYGNPGGGYGDPNPPSRQKRN